MSALSPEKIDISKDRILNLLNTLPSLVLVLDNEYNVEFVNESYCHYFEQPPGDFQGEFVFDILPDDLGDKIHTRLEELKQGNSTITHEIEVSSPDGDTHWQEWTYHAEFDNQGNVIHYYGIGDDITQHRQRQQELDAQNQQLQATEQQLRAEIEERKESQHRFRTLYEESPVALWEQDLSDCKDHLESIDVPDDRNLADHLDDNPEILQEAIAKIDILSLNKELLELVGASDRDEILAGLDKIFTDDTYDLLPKQFDALLSGESTYENETVINTLDGEEKHILYRIDLVPEFEDWSRVFVSYVDITERTQNRHELEATFDTSLSYLALLDPEGSIQRINEAGVEIAKVPEEDLLGEKFWQASWWNEPDLRDTVRQKINRAGEGESVQFTTRFKGRDGTRHAEVAFTPITSPNGPEIQYILAEGRDITAYKTSEQRFRSLYEHSPVPLWEVDLSDAKDYLDELHRKYEINDLEQYLLEHDDKLQSLAGKIHPKSVNQEAVELIGAESEAEARENLAQSFTHDTLEKLSENFAALYSEHSQFEAQTTIKSFDGEKKSIIYRTDLLTSTDQTQDWSRVFVSWQDVTELNEALEELDAQNQQLDAYNQQLQATEQQLRAEIEERKQNERRLRLAQESANIGIWEWDVNSGELTWDDQMVDHFGIKAKEYDDFLQSVIKEDRDEVDEMVRECLDTGETFHKEYRVVHGETDQVRWIDAYGTVQYNEDENPVAVLGACLDITERKQREQELLAANQQLDAQNQQLDAYNQQLQATEQQLRAEVEERKQKQQALEQKQNRLNLAQEAGRIGIWDWQVQDGELHWDNQMVELFGVEATEYDDFIDRVHPDDREFVNDAVKRSMESRESFHIQYQINHGETGESRWIDARAEVHYENGEPRAMIGSCIDITDRKQNEEQIKSLNQELQAIIDSSPAAIVTLDADHNVTSWNPAAEDMFGYEEDEVVGEPIPVVPDDEREKFNRSLDQLKQGESIDGLEADRVTRDGARIQTRAYAAPIYEGNEYRGTVGIISDISEEKQLQQELRRREQRFTQLAESIDEVHWLVDKDVSELLYINPAAEDVYGFSRAELEEDFTQFYDHIHDEDLPDLEHALDQAASGEVAQYQFRFERNGETAWIEAEAYPVRDDEGNVTRLAGVNRDITERKQLQQDLRDQRNLLEEVIDSSPNPIYVKDWEGRFELANQQLADLLDQEVDDLIGEPQDRFFDEETVLKLQEVDRKAMRNAEPIQIDEQRIDHPLTGEEKIYRTSKIPLDLDQPPEDRRVLGVSIDLTEQKQIQDELKRSLEEKQTLVKEVHHRVKNNMQVISSLLKLQSYRLEDDDALHCIQESKSRVQSMAMIHEKLYQSDQLSEVKLDDYVSDLTRDLVQAHKTKEISPRTEVNVDAEVSLDLDHIIPVGLIINELVVNSIEHGFTPETERPRITVSFELTDADQAHLTVADNGRGLPEDFDPEDHDSLGFQLLQSLAGDQLNGDYEIHEDDGTVTKVTFPYNA